VKVRKIAGLRTPYPPLDVSLGEVTYTRFFTLSSALRVKDASMLNLKDALFESKMFMFKELKSAILICLLILI
jgi:hypothetical protein